MDDLPENELIRIICIQTSYTKEEAKEKLVLFDNNHISVIKDYLNVPIEKKKPIESVNQEIYKQIRYKLNESIDIINKINYEKLNQYNF
jgi:hypothetical protein